MRPEAKPFQVVCPACRTLLNVQPPADVGPRRIGRDRGPEMKGRRDGEGVAVVWGALLLVAAYLATQYQAGPATPAPPTPAVRPAKPDDGRRPRRPKKRHPLRPIRTEEADRGPAQADREAREVRHAQAGGLVLWRHTPDGEASPAAVTRVGQNAIAVMIFPPDSRAGIPKDGVMHVSDPRAKTLAQPDAGLWDYTDETKLLMRLADALAVEHDGE